METFGKITYVICIASICASLALAIVKIWADVPEPFLWKALGTALAFFGASAIAFSVNQAFMKQGEKKSDENR